MPNAALYATQQHNHASQCNTPDVHSCALADLITSTGQDWAQPQLQIPQAKFGSKTLADLGNSDHTAADALQAIQQSQVLIDEITMAYSEALQTAGMHDVMPTASSWCATVVNIPWLA